MGEGAAVGEGYELCKGVGSFWAPEERGVADLVIVEALWTAGRFQCVEREAAAGQ